MLLDSRSGYSAKIRPKVISMWSANRIQCFHTTGRNSKYLCRFFVGKLTQLLCVLVRDNHEMAAVVRKKIQHHVAMLSPPDHEILPILFFFLDPTEEARFSPLLAECLDIDRPPWGIESFHGIDEQTSAHMAHGGKLAERWKEPPDRLCVSKPDDESVSMDLRTRMRNSLVTSLLGELRGDRTEKAIALAVHEKLSLFFTTFCSAHF